MNNLTTYLMILLLFSMISCAGTGGKNPVVFTTAGYPVSLSSWVLSQEGSPLHISQMERKGTFYSKKEGWATFWGLIPLSPVDFSEALNSQVKRANGDAVVNLNLKAVNPASNYFFTLNWFPFWPGRVGLEVTGSIVKQKKNVKNYK